MHIHTFPATLFSKCRSEKFHAVYQPLHLGYKVLEANSMETSLSVLEKYLKLCYHKAMCRLCNLCWQIVQVFIKGLNYNSGRS